MINSAHCSKGSPPEHSQPRSDRARLTPILRFKTGHAHKYHAAPISAILARSLRITPQRVHWRMRSCWQGRADGFTDRFPYSYHIVIDLRNANVQHSRHRRYPLYIRARGHPGRTSHGQPRTPSAKSPEPAQASRKTLHANAPSLREPASSAPPPQPTVKTDRGAR